MRKFFSSGRLWKTTTFSKPLTVRTGDTMRMRNGVVEVVDKDGSVIESGTYEEEIHDS